jgi:hypothetical protein
MELGQLRQRKGVGEITGLCSMKGVVGLKISAVFPSDVANYIYIQLGQVKKAKVLYSTICTSIVVGSIGVSILFRAG